MSFVVINSSEIEAGDPVTQELFTKVKDSLDNHETRILSVEAASQSIFPIKFEVISAYASPATTGVIYERIFQNITLTSGKIFVVDAGVSGTTEIDIKYKRGVGAFTSIFSVAPSVAFGLGDNYLSTNGVLSTTAILSGDILRLDITTGQECSKITHFYINFNFT